jgi:hypothetical protein
MLDDVEQTKESGMTARDFAKSKGIPSTLSDEEAAILDKYGVKMLDDSAGDGLKISDKQFGKKAGKHTQDFGLDAGSSENRDLIRNKVNEIHKKPTEIREGVFRGQGDMLPNGGNATGKVKFYIQGNDVVVTDMNDNFITIMKDGINNPKVKTSTKVWP